MTTRSKRIPLMASMTAIYAAMPKFLADTLQHGPHRRKRQNIKYRPDQQTFTKILPAVQKAWGIKRPEVLSRQTIRAEARAYVKAVIRKRMLMERQDYRKYKGLVAIRTL